MLREDGITGVHAHVRRFRQYLGRLKVDAPVVTPFSWNRTLTVPVFGLRLAVERCSSAAGVVWYRHWHELFLRYALRRRLAELGECVSTPKDLWRRELHCGHGAGNSSASSGLSTSVSRWARDALLGWFPEAAAVPATVIFRREAPNVMRDIWC
jgi:hypothetical protein